MRPPGLRTLLLSRPHSSQAPHPSMALTTQAPTAQEESRQPPTRHPQRCHLSRVQIAVPYRFQTQHFAGSADNPTLRLSRRLRQRLPPFRVYTPSTAGVTRTLPTGRMTTSTTKRRRRKKRTPNQIRSKTLHRQHLSALHAVPSFPQDLGATFAACVVQQSLPWTSRALQRQGGPGQAQVVSPRATQRRVTPPPRALLLQPSRGRRRRS